jgi:hypothetical protein
VRAYWPNKSPINISTTRPITQNSEIETEAGLLKNQKISVSKIKSGVKSTLKILS